MHRNTARDPYGVYVNTASGTPMGYVSRSQRPLWVYAKITAQCVKSPRLTRRYRGNSKRNIPHAPSQIFFLPLVRIEPSQSKSANYPRSKALSELAPSKNQRDILLRLLSLSYIDQKPKGFRGISRFIARYIPIRPYKSDRLK